MANQIPIRGADHYPLRAYCDNVYGCMPAPPGQGIFSSIQKCDMNCRPTVRPSALHEDLFQHPSSGIEYETVPLRPSISYADAERIMLRHTFA